MAIANEDGTRKAQPTGRPHESCRRVFQGAAIAAGDADAAFFGRRITIAASPKSTSTVLRRWPEISARSIGRVFGFPENRKQAVRFESLERLFRLARQRSQQGTFQATTEMKGAVGVKDAELEQVMAALGFAAVKDSDTLEFRQKLRRPETKKAL